MKKIIHLVAAALCVTAFTAQAQLDSTSDAWLDLSSGLPHIVTKPGFSHRVGIGTQNPNAKLHITQIDYAEKGLKVKRGLVFGEGATGDLVDVSHDYDLSGSTVNSPDFIVNGEGKIGLGTRGQTAWLHQLKPTYQSSSSLDRYLVRVESATDDYTAFGINEGGLTHVGEVWNDAMVTQSTRSLFEVWSTDNTAIDMNANYLVSFWNRAGDGRALRVKGGWAHASNDTPIFQVESNGNYDENVRFRILANGKVAVGDLNMNLPNGYRLFVDDGIITERLRVAVTNSSDWADYVFEDDYELRPISEVAAFIEEHKHLPGIPSAESVVASGIDVAKMDAALLQKIEELTLYMVQLEAQNQLFAQELELLKNDLKK